MLMNTTTERLNVYLDLNVYSRPFDDQTKEKIRRETEAINAIWDAVKKGAIRLVSSDVLYLEVKKILSESKRAKVTNYVKLCEKHVAQNETVEQIAQAITDSCGIRSRDALHLASAVVAEVDFCLTCDTQVARKSTNRCVKRLAKKFGKPYVAVMDPIRFVEKFFSHGDK
jgi:predicted nucleic acid-binding protein